MTFEEIKQLLEIVREHELSEFELERDDFKIRIRRQSGAQVVALAAPAGPVAAGTVPVIAAAVAPTAVPQPPTAPPAAEPRRRRQRTGICDRQVADRRHVLPIARARRGVVRRDRRRRCKKGQVLCIIEAMKLMNEIDSEYDGEIVNVYVENGQPVQYGERLFAIRTR